MADDVGGVKTKDPKVTADERAALPATRLTDIDPAVITSMEKYIEDAVQRIRARRQRFADMKERIREILEGRNPDPPMRAGASNVSVPLMIWAHANQRAKLSRSFFGHDPPVRIALPGPKDVDRSDEQTIADHLGDFLVHQLKSVRGLNARATLDAVDADAVNYGSGTWAVISEPPRVRHFPPRPGNEAETDAGFRRVITAGRVYWHPIDDDDLYVFDGYYTDVNRMPFVGYRVRKTWADIKQWAAQDHYDPKVVEAVEAFFDSEQRDEAEKPAALREHNVLEGYADWDVNKDGFTEPVVFDYHLDACRIMRVGWSQYEGRRPVVSYQYDLPPRSSDFRGHGLGAKLESAQTEASAIHNIGIEGGKRGIANILIVREGSGVDEEIGADEVVLPGAVYVTSMPANEAVQSIPLGDPRAAEAAIMLEERNTQYAFRILGHDESGLGQVSSGKRVPARLGVPIMREGRVTTESAMISKANAIEEACYLTFTAMKRNLPERALTQVLGPEGADAIRRIVFSPTDDIDLRDRFIIKVEAKDVSATMESRKQSMLMLSQFLISVYDRLNKMFLMAKQLPEAADVQSKIIKKLNNAVRIMLQTADEVDDPTDVLLTSREIDELIAGAGGGVGGGVGGPAPDAAEAAPEGGPDDIERMGGGVT
jgi:hypothetical protein